MKEKYKSTILEFLIKKCCIGGAHTPLDRVKSCIDLHSKQEKKFFDDALHELIKDGWIIALNKRTGKGSDIHLSINPKALNEIKNFLRI